MASRTTPHINRPCHTRCTPRALDGPSAAHAPGPLAAQGHALLGLRGAPGMRPGTPPQRPLRGHWTSQSLIRPHSASPVCVCGGGGGSANAETTPAGAPAAAATHTHTPAQHTARPGANSRHGRCWQVSGTFTDAHARRRQHANQANKQSNKAIVVCLIGTQTTKRTHARTRTHVGNRETRAEQETR